MKKKPTNMYHCTLCEGTSPAKNRVLLNRFFLFLKIYIINLRYDKTNKTKNLLTAASKQAMR